MITKLKSFVAIKAMFRGFEKFKSPKYLIVVTEVAHIENWKKEFVKCLGKERAETVLGGVTIICYASLKKMRDTSWDIVCFDEAHHLGSDLRINILQTIKAKRVLALSATLKDDVLRVLTDTFGTFEINKISLQSAIDKEFLPEPKIICISLELERFKRTITIELDYRTVKSGDKGKIQDYWSNRWKYMKNRKSYAGYLIELFCTEKEKYDYINEQFDYWKKMYFRQQGNERLKNMWLQWGSKRKRFLGELKTQRALELVGKLRYSNTKFICFCSSIEQADYLGKPFAIHSNNSDSQKLIKEFNENKINELFAVNMLQEGVSLSGIQKGIIIQLDGVERGFVQKAGRMFRAKNPVIYIFYYKDTRDEEYLQKAIEGINEEYIIKE